MKGHDFTSCIQLVYNFYVCIYGLLFNRMDFSATLCSLDIACINTDMQGSSYGHRSVQHRPTTNQLLCGRLASVESTQLLCELFLEFRNICVDIGVTSEM